jgi:hypothetical protein
VVNPVDLIAKCRSRIARLAAIETGLYAVLPLIVTIAIAVVVGTVGAFGWERWGYALAPGRLSILKDAVVALAILEVLVAAFFAWRAWGAASDFVAAAARIDDLVEARQEVVTLATLADPAKPVTLEERSPLFPLLWRRVIRYLDTFDPRSRFKLAPGRPLAWSSLLALGVVILLGLTALAMVRPATAVEVLSQSLRDFARSLDKSPTPSDHELAAAARDVAADLQNHKLPPEQKQAELEALKQQLEQREKQRNGSGNGNSGGNNASGQGNGSGQGSGQGTGKGAGGSAPGQGGANGKGDKSNNQMAELRNDMSKAQAQMEMQSGEGNKSQVAQQKGDKGTGLTPKQGENPNQAGPQSQPNGTGNIELPKPANMARNQTPSGGAQSGQKDDKGTSGDTHLGDFPKAANYERFYKLGEKGPPIDIRDARYVVFRMPAAVVSPGGEGKTVADASSPLASVPYTNVPLKEGQATASPDEQQLVPPRYRDLIR